MLRKPLIPYIGTLDCNARGNEIKRNYIERKDSSSITQMPPSFSLGFFARAILLLSMIYIATSD
jgi:hypothetical protein